jgi:hypothetical protein
VSAIVVVSHTYVERENRGKLRALAADGPVITVVPDHWAEGALQRAWRLPPESRDGAVTLVAARWHGATRPSLGMMRVPWDRLPPADVLQIEEEPWTPTAYLAARARRRVATVLFTWENVARQLPPPWSWMRRATLARVDGVIAGSAGAADEARRQGYRGPLAVIPQLGVEVADGPVRAAGSEGPLRVAFAGRLTHEKGVDVLLRALARMEAPAHLRILGDGPERGGLERLARELGVADRVQFLGAWPHERVATIWPETDVLVLPSRTTPRWKEQLGHVLLEAMAHRVAVVGSTCGAIPEVVGEAGLVFPEGEIGALTAHLELLARDPLARARLAGAGRERVAAEFTNARIAARTRAFHAEVLARR